VATMEAAQLNGHPRRAGHPDRRPDGGHSRFFATLVADFQAVADSLDRRCGCSSVPPRV